MKPLVSICCLAYNQQEFIGEAMDSFLMQETGFPFEIIIHDDASTDGTTEIILEYERQNADIMRPIYQKENQYSKNRVYPYLSMYRAARGKYIAECDGDDFWTDPRKLARQVEFLEKNPAYSMCYHDYVLLQNGVISKPSAEPPGDYTPDELIAFEIRGYGIATNAKVWRNLLGPDTYRYFDNVCGDYPLNVVMGMYGGCKFIPGIAPSVYRKHAHNTWSGTPDTAWRTRQMHRRLYEQISETGNDHYIALRKRFL